MLLVSFGCVTTRNNTAGNNAAPQSTAEKQRLAKKTPDGKPITVVLNTRPVEGKLNSPFGPRKLSKKRTRKHTGIDIAAKRGTAVVATAHGTVCFVGRNGAYGKLVDIDHGNGIITRYAHLDTIVATPGVTIAAGEQLGTVGRTGRTTGPNLHFEVIIDGKKVDPLSVVKWS